MNDDSENDIAKAAVGCALTFLAVALLLLLLAIATYADTTNYFYPTNSIPIPRPVITFTNDLYRVFPTNLIISGGPVATNVVPPAQVKITLVASSLNPTGPFWVRADVTNISSVVKVTFVVDGANYHDESIPPYFMCGDNGVTPTLCTLSNGTHTIVAKVFTNSSGTGVPPVQSPPLTITVSGTGVPPVVSNPAPPSSLTATGVTTGSISFVWSYDQSSNAPNNQAVGFIFELSKITSNNFVPVWSNANVAVTNTTIQNLTANTMYWGRVRAYN